MQEPNLRYNIIELLLDRHIEAGLGNSNAIIDSNQSITYKQLYQFVTAIPSLIEETNALPRGSVVACIFEDSIDSVICFLGLIRIGLVPCYLNPRLPPSEYNYYMETCSAKLILAPEEVAQKLTKTLSPNLKIKTIDSLAMKNNAPTKSADKLDIGLDDRPAFCIFSSGTTGRPSAVLHRHKDIEVMNQNYAQQILKIQQQDILFTTSKLFFAYGLNSLLFALYHGATAILAPVDLNRNLIWEIIVNKMPTLLFSVPTMYSLLLECPNALEIKHIRLCISAGEHLPEHIQQSWRRRHNKDIIDGIGTTEILSTFISNYTDCIQQNSTGKLVPGFEAKLLKDDNTEAQAGEVGVLWVKGNTYSSGYLNNEQATQERFSNNWFKTNDLFLRDEYGYYFYQGRADYLIKCGGVWINPNKMENILNSHSDIKECAVIGEIQANGLMRPVAYIVLKNLSIASDKLKKDLQLLCKKSCSNLEYPHFINFIDQIPKTASGKMKRYSLSQIHKQELINDYCNS